MTFHRHPTAGTEARMLVDTFDGSAEEMVETALEAKIGQGDLDEALHLDQVRREIEKVYETEGK